jgi:FtsP/CotA-like multicopper oxidase with cupredoxin domain
VNPPSRRQVLGWGLAGGAMTAAGAAGLWWGSRPQPGTGGPWGGPSVGYPGAGATGGPLAEPDRLTSTDGVLELDLEAAPAAVAIGGRQARVWAFNGSLPGPTLEVSPGDTLRVRMANRLDGPTNLHVHGLHVSPKGAGDNPFVSIGPGESHDYEFVLPSGHLPGTYWYHPHHHGHVAEQLAAGLYGAILVRDIDPVPVTRERVLVVSDLTLDADGSRVEPSPMERMMGREGRLVLVNGQVQPRLAAAPGERERWRIVNACPSRFLRLTLEGQRLRLFARDQGRLREPPEVDRVDRVDLAPGNRVELLVEATEGTSTLVAAPVDRGSMPGMMGGTRPGGTGPVELLRLDVAGDQAGGLGAVPAGPQQRDLRGEDLARRRTLDFGMGGMGGGMMRGEGAMMSFTVNGREFDADRTDVAVRAGDVEEWTLVNSSPMDHPIHLHVWPMQLITVGQGGEDVPRWADVVTVPAFGQVTVRVAFEDVTGRSVFHCHILDHEDLGMMGTVEVG